MARMWKIRIDLFKVIIKFKPCKEIKMKKIILACCCLAFSTIVLADNCDQTRNTFDDIYCVNKLYASADGELNKNYQSLRDHLNAQQKKVLKRSQVAWIKDRDQTCTDGSTVDVACRLEQTQQRNNWLRERIRECKTIGCKTSALN